MKNINTILLVVILGIVGWLVLGGNSQQGMLGGAFGQPGVVDLGSRSLASSSFRFAANTTVLALDANPSRAYARCANGGKDTVYLSFASTASGSWGIGLKASESYEILTNQNLYRGKIYARSGEASRISCIER